MLLLTCFTATITLLPGRSDGTKETEGELPLRDRAFDPFVRFSDCAILASELSDPEFVVDIIRTQDEPKLLDTAWLYLKNGSSLLLRSW